VRILLTADPSAAGDLVAREIARAVDRDPATVLGVATGGSPEPVYRSLARAGVRLPHATAFALDEYVGLPPGHPESYRAVLQRLVQLPLGLAADRLHVPDGAAADPDAEAAAYDARIDEAGGVGLQLLGIGRNGHIAFNEPGSALDTPTRVVRLTEDTRRANARFFTGIDDVPERAITQGLGTIARARRLMLIATTEDKADAVRALVRGPVTSDLPASILRIHPDATVVLTPEAATGLSEEEFEAA